MLHYTNSQVDQRWKVGEIVSFNTFDAMTTQISVQKRANNYQYEYHF